MKSLLTITLLFISISANAFILRSNTLLPEVVIDTELDHLYLFDKNNNKWKVTPDCSLDHIAAKQNVKVTFTSKNLAKSNLVIRTIDGDKRRPSVDRCKVLSVSMM